MMPPFRPITAAVNHLLRATPVAMERLRPFAGRTARFRVGALDVAFTVQTTGEVTAALPEAPRDLEVRLSPFLLPRLAIDESAWSEVAMEGDERFAGEVRFLARHLRWDAEEDLSRAIGDVAAHRAMGAMRDGVQWARESGKRLAASAAEFWTEERPLIASRQKLSAFVRDTDRLREDLARLEQRIGRLEGR